MSRQWAKFAIVLSLSLIMAVVVMGFQSMAATPSPDAQRVRMYFVFAAYVILLLAVWSLRKTKQGRRPVTGWSKRIKVVVGSITVAGSFFVVGVVLSVIIGGADTVETAIPVLLYAVPAIAIVFAPLINERMS